MNQMENEALDKSKSRPLGTRIGYTAGHSAHPYASVYATPSRRMKRDRDLEQESPTMSRVHDVDILPEHAADAVRIDTYFSISSYNVHVHVQNPHAIHLI